jgi:alanyl aminopeptidase
MQLRFLAAFALSLVIAACGQEKAPAPKNQSERAQAPVPNEPVPLAQLPRVASPMHYAVTLTIDPKKDRFSGHTEIKVDFTQARRALFIHGLEIHMAKARAVLPGGKTVNASWNEVDKSGVVRLIFDSEIPKGPVTLVFDYDAPYNTSLAGLYKVVDRGENYAFTQFENTDARRAFPSFDEPGFKAPFDITVIAPSGDSVVGNTPVASATPAGNGMTKTVFKPTQPLPTYLIALAVGPLDIVDGGVVPPSKLRSYAIPIRGVTAKGNGPRIKYALSLTASIIQKLEDYYGIAYPFEKLDVLAVPDFAAGAMENAGAITYRERLLLDSDQSLEQKRGSLTVQAHELAHQWFGDLVTPVWWDDIWLNESFANWMEAKAAEAVRPKEEYSRNTLSNNLEVMHLDEMASARQIHQPVHNEDDINNAFDSITYDKGAAVLAMFESYVGEQGWRAGIHAYLKKFAFKNATTQDFISTIAKETNHPEIVAAFNSYIDQAGVPELTIDFACEANEREASIKQAMYAQIGRTAPSRTWGVPACLADETGKKNCALIGDNVTQVNLKTACTSAIFPNVDGKGYYRFALTEPDWAALIAAAPKLTPADQLTLFENIDAGFRAGKVPATKYFGAIKALAPVASWDTIASIRESLRNFRNTILAPGDLAAYRAFVAEQFVPRLKAVGYSEKPGEAPATMLAREYLAGAVVGEARDPATIAALAKAVQPYVASAGKNTGGLAPDILSDALRAGVLAGGAPFADALLAAMQMSDSEDFRRRGIYALAVSDDPAVLKKAVALGGRLRVGEIRYLYQYFSAEPAARAAMWSTLKTNFEAIKARVSSQGFGRAPGLLAETCDMASKNDVQSFFGPKTKDLEGTPRTLAETTEKIGYCIAFKDAKAADFAAALHAAALAPAPPTIKR